MEEHKKYEHGFKAPEDYFEQLEDRLMQSLEEEELPGVTGFQTPSDYFDTLEQRVMDRLELTQTTTKIIPLYQRKSFVYGISIAASFMLLLALFWNPPKDTFDKLEVADIEAYFEEGSLDVDSYDIAQLLSEEDLEQLPEPNDLFSDESLEDYLLENLDDTSLLIE